MASIWSKTVELSALPVLEGDAVTDVLIVGGGHRTGKKGGAWRELESFAHRHYPGSRVKYRWRCRTA